MNIYVVLEGREASKKIYQNWIPYINPQLTPITYPNQFRDNNFLIIMGGGQSEMKPIVQNGVNDVNIMGIDRLVIAIDSEDSTYEEKKSEIESFVQPLGCRAEVKYVIQHFCLETWLLGNWDQFRVHPYEKQLIEYMRIFNVRENDPELLPEYHEMNWNRSQFAYAYLQAGIRDKSQRKNTYSKSNPGLTIHKKYFNYVKRRWQEKNHICSLTSFIDAFS